MYNAKSFGPGLGVDAMSVGDFMEMGITTDFLRKLEHAIRLCRHLAEVEYLQAGSPVEVVGGVRVKKLTHEAKGYLVRAARLRALLLANLPTTTMNSMNKSGKLLALNLLSDADF